MIRERNRLIALIEETTSDQNLGPAFDFGTPVLPEGVNRTPGQARVLGEDPFQHLRISESVIAEQREQPREPMHEFTSHDQLGGNLLPSANQRHCSGQMVVPDPGSDLVDAHPELVCCFLPIEPVLDQLPQQGFLTVLT